MLTPDGKIITYTDFSDDISDIIVHIRNKIMVPVIELEYIPTRRINKMKKKGYKVNNIKSKHFLEDEDEEN